MAPKEIIPDTQEAFFKPFFKRLDELNGQYCVLHSYEALPLRAEGDVDIAIHGIDVKYLERMLCNLCNEIDWSITQRLWYDIPVCLYYVVQPNSMSGTSVKVDFMLDPTGIGYTYYSTGFLTSQPVNTTFFTHSNPTIEFCYKLTKRIRKGFFKENDTETLNSLYKLSDRLTVRSELVRQFGESGADSILNIFDNPGQFSGKIPEMRALAQVQIRRSNYSSVLRLIKKAYWHIYRLTYRILHPCGMVILMSYSEYKKLAALHKPLPAYATYPFRNVLLKEKTSFLDRFRALSGSTLLISISQINDNEILIHDRQLSLAKKFEIGLSGNTRNETTTYSGIGTIIMQILLERTQKRICH